MVQPETMMDCPLSEAEQTEERADLLPPVEFVPTSLNYAVKLTGKANAVFPPGTPLAYAYVHYLAELSKPLWWMHFYGEKAPDLVDALGGSLLGTVGGMVDRPIWADFVALLRGTVLDPGSPQWIPSLPVELSSQYAPSDLCRFPDLYHSRIARAWRDVYGVESQGQPVNVATVRPVWYEEQRPAWVVME